MARTLGLGVDLRPKSLPWLLLAPTVLFVGAMTVLPLAYSVVTSFQEFPLGQAPAFVGLQNYRNLIGDANFLSSLETTLVFTISATGLEFVLGLGLALLLKQEFSFQGTIRSSLIVPMAIAPVVRNPEYSARAIPNAPTTATPPTTSGTRS